MPRRIRALVSWVAFAAVSAPAPAYVGPASIAPATPVAGQPVTLNVPSGICDAIGTSLSYPNDGFPQITVDGNTITALFYTAHADDPEYCFYPEYIWAQPLGSFPAGEYTIIVNRWSDWFTPPIQSVGELSMTVLAAPEPVAAPALGSLSRLAMAATLLVLGGFAVRRRQTGARPTIAPGAALPVACTNTKASARTCSDALPSPH